MLIVGQHINDLRPHDSFADRSVLAPVINMAVGRYDDAAVRSSRNVSVPNTQWSRVQGSNITRKVFIGLQAVAEAVARTRESKSE
jgi:hypothetical protein